MKIGNNISYIGNLKLAEELSELDNQKCIDIVYWPLYRTGYNSISRQIFIPIYAAMIKNETGR
jgi:hypothetical protein